jgi:ATP-binding cassette, subfamily B, bacterial
MRSIPLLSPDSTTKKPSAQPSANDLLVAKAGYASSAAAPAHSCGKKFLSYYKPYLGLFFADMACALIVSTTTLLLPLCARYITKNILGLFRK